MSNFKLKFSKAYDRIIKQAAAIGALLTVKRGRPLVSLLVRLVVPLGVRTKPGLVRVIITYVSDLSKLAKHGGRRFVVIYLKAATVVLQQACGGQKLQNMGPLGLRFARSKGGLPRIIPMLHRHRIRKGDIWVIRLWMTLFALYRVINIAPSLKLDTITDPSRCLPQMAPDFSAFVAEWFLPSLPNGGLEEKRRTGGPLAVLESLIAKPFLISKSSPSARSRHTSYISTSPESVLEAAFLWSESPLYTALQSWCKMTKNIWVLNRMEDITKGFRPAHLRKGWTTSTLGRLGFKEEAAGKVRVFAMVDPWTQWLMDPLHRGLFDILYMIPQDGTRNQLHPLESLLVRGVKPLYSYDLSAATDRLPLTVQKVLLSPFLTSWGAEVWGQLLVGRPYVAENEALGVKTQDLYYATGQPMGALSSWAMLALTHHAIVQWAAVKAGVVTTKGEWFEDYAVLGDDIVIGNKKVAKKYLGIMSDMGVGINQSKSLDSRHGTALEFAKRFYVKTSDASPVPLKEFIAGCNSVTAMMELVKKYSMSLAQMLTALGYGYKSKGMVTKRLMSLPSRLRNYILAYYGPTGPGYKSLKEYLGLKALGTPYKTVDQRSVQLLERFIQEERKFILERLDSLRSLLETAKKLIVVYRDREHYGTESYQGPWFSTNVLRSVPSGFLEAPWIMDALREMLYRGAFLDLLSTVSDIRAKVEETFNDPSTVEEGVRIETITETGAVPASGHDPRAEFKAHLARTVEPAWIPEYDTEEEFQTWYGASLRAGRFGNAFVEIRKEIYSAPPIRLSRLELASQRWEVIEGLWTQLDSLADSIGALSLPRELVKRTVAKARVSETDNLKRWYRYSTIFRQASKG